MDSILVLSTECRTIFSLQKLSTETILLETLSSFGKVIDRQITPKKILMKKFLME